MKAFCVYPGETHFDETRYEMDWVDKIKEVCDMKDGGHEKLWEWFELSYASFLIMPRVLMHSMPDEWQGKMADLLDEYDNTFPNQPNIGTTVRATKDGKLAKMPEWLIDYRHPDYDEINKLREV